MPRPTVMSRRGVVLAFLAGVLAAGVFAAVAGRLRIDEQPVFCSVPDGEVTPVCRGPDGEASTTALVLAGLLGFLLAFAVVALLRRRHRSR